MASLLDQLKTFTTVVADTGDFASEQILPLVPPCSPFLGFTPLNSTLTM